MVEVEVLVFEAPVAVVIAAGGIAGAVAFLPVLGILFGGDGWRDGSAEGVALF